MQTKSCLESQRISFLCYLCLGDCRFEQISAEVLWWCSICVAGRSVSRVVVVVVAAVLLLYVVRKFCDSGRMQNSFYLLLVLHVAEGCILKDHGKTKHIIAYTGGSVLLPCSCTDLHTTPERVTWMKKHKNKDKWEEISSESGQYRNRVQLVNGHSPGNLSLLISHLTEEDERTYQCSGGYRGYIYIILTVKGCTLETTTEMLTIKAHTRGSVLLPCYCTDLNTRPKKFTWKKNSKRGTWQEISSESGQYRDRVQLVNGHSPGNLSLLISHLTEEDGGDYRCDAMKSGSIYIGLTVEVDPAKTTITPVVNDRTSPVTSTNSSSTMSLQHDVSSPSAMDSKFFIYAAVGGLLLLLVLIGVIYWRYKAQRQKQMESCEKKMEWKRDRETQNNCEVLYDAINKEDNCKKVEENDDVTYSTVVHSKRSTPATVLLDTEETTEYASIKLN
ncbi:cell surface A33 antigen-like [Colossoma macropomum]|uniref:cell surface A33 antigen-like n=1 Tax=Colossoma macropomum TaxID=42526 RepID=UPI00186552AF|nr:cell surface A33 antigen-like [Colossoma macropomum]